MNNGKSLWGSVLILMISAVNLPAGELTILTEENPPYNFTLNGSISGIATDLLLEAAGISGLNLSSKDISVVPWARGYQITSTRPGAMLYSMARTPAREALFLWAGPIEKITIAVIGPAGTVIRHPDDLTGYRIGTIMDGAPEQMLIELGIPLNSLVRGTSLESLVRMLSSGRVDLIAYNTRSARYHMLELGMDADAFEPVYILREAELWYGFNRETDAGLIRRLQAGIDKVKTSGSYNRVVNRYLGSR